MVISLIATNIREVNTYAHMYTWVGQKIDLRGLEFSAKECTLIVVKSGKFAAEKLAPVSSYKAKFGCHTFKDDRCTERVLTRWLITQDREFNQKGIKEIPSHCTIHS
jgi:hypothetical protein